MPMPWCHDDIIYSNSSQRPTQRSTTTESGTNSSMDEWVVLYIPFICMAAGVGQDHVCYHFYVIQSHCAHFSMREGCFVLSMTPEEYPPWKTASELHVQCTNRLLCACTWAVVAIQEYQWMQTVLPHSSITGRKSVKQLCPTASQENSPLEISLFCNFCILLGYYCTLCHTVGILLCMPHMILFYFSWCGWLEM